jgi:hypothetical protein
MELGNEKFSFKNVIFFIRRKFILEGVLYQRSNFALCALHSDPMAGHL